jgi:tetratricopeptide (TPR) repeat protein
VVGLFGVFMLLAAVWGSVYAYGLYQLSMARRLLQEEQPAEARKHLQFCLRVWPFARDPAVHFLAGRAARMNFDFKDAQAHLNRCLALEGGTRENTQLEFYLMRVQQGDIDELAPTLLEYVDSGHPDRVLILETMARQYMRTMRYGLAYRFLSRWIDLGNQGLVEISAKPYHWRAWVMDHLGNATEAMNDYSKALELDPDSYPVRARIAELLLEEFKPGEALPHLDLLIQQHPDSAEVKARLGHCRILEGKFDEALPLLEAALEGLPNDPPTLHDLAKLASSKGHYSEARAWLERALKFDPSDTEALYQLYLNYQSEGLKTEAEKTLALYNKKSGMLQRVNRILRDEAKHPTNDPKVCGELGALLMQVERETEGLYWLNKTLEFDPNNQEAHRALAQYYDKKGEREKALLHHARLKTPVKQ